MIFSKVNQKIIYFSAILALFSSKPIFAGIADTIDSLRKTYDQFVVRFDQLEKAIKSLYEVLQTIADVFQTIHSLFGIEIIIFAIIVFILAGGLNSIGIARGKMALVISIGIADFFWIIWVRAGSPESLDYVYKIIKTNLLMLSPYIVVMGLKKFYPYVKDGIRRLVLSRRSFEKEELVNHSKRIMELYKDFSVNIQEDMIKNDDQVVLSSDTVSSIKKLEKELKYLKILSVRKLKETKTNTAVRYNDNERPAQVSSGNSILEDYDDRE